MFAIKITSKKIRKIAQGERTTQSTTALSASSIANCWSDEGGARWDRKYSERRGVASSHSFWLRNEKRHDHITRPSGLWRTIKRRKVDERVFLGSALHSQYCGLCVCAVSCVCVCRHTFFVCFRAWHCNDVSDSSWNQYCDFELFNEVVLYIFHLAMASKKRQESKHKQSLPKNTSAGFYSKYINIGTIF
jgi:hypothetical protein